ncbi:type IX secretion system periplasmic lipoprotein PorW/SprE [Flavivirga rizhaonensis]|uniref:Tetratricopeptide repeat protein n=1 Tax=Flavivirga rizhaonensis TaxID=2559571 RepID=A0A4S1E1N7_9FLAO|nr:tetratricopeptide repeat protein [Flavivirga rizhaonensis]TGV03822.1 tetratricopeptide repeat protein [Flavivirga rizhaonensis]
MKRSSKAILIILCATLLVVSCSRKKDKFITRNFHALTAEFNTLYNGYNALEEGRLSLNENYTDNYWDILPIERMQIFDEVVLPGQSKNESFTRAEEKAVKAIQKHSMNIDGKEKNPQMDEAYLLLGKSRYFDQRFIPALEAFNYILYKYPASDKINQAKVWREKTNIRLNNDDLAIENLKRLLFQEELKGQDLADATSMLAQAYLNTKSIDSAITQLEIASNATKSNDERGRYRFIQGQLYNKLGKKDSANIAFDKVIELNRKTPRIYMIGAHIEKIKNFDYENGNKLEVTELLTELQENRENRPFLDKIYHQIAEYHLNNQSDSLATVYYNKSLRTNSRDKILKARNYEILGDMNFDKSIYKAAGEYYDSTLGTLVLNSKPYRIIKRKRDNLEDVIYYEAKAQVNDSVLRLVNLSEAERLTYFESLVEKLKIKAKEEEEKKKREEAAKRNTGLATVNNTFVGQNPQRGTPNQAPVFYFYNPTTVAYGKNEFIKIWGDRNLEDDWRWSSKVNSGDIYNDTNNVDILALATEEELFDPQFYISKIPSDKKEIDSISKDRNYAYYQLGLIYKEKFKEYELAKSKFQNLLESNPEERLILPSKYNLYKIYEILGENGEAEIAKNEIISKYPDSRYATILSNPELASGRDENSPESLYEALYKQHGNQEYAKVISKSEKYISMFDGNAIVPKLELLKATAIGRLRGYEAYKEAVNYVALTYANTQEGIQAQNIEASILPKLMNKDFISDDNVTTNYKIIFKFENPDMENVYDFQKILDEVLKNIRYYDLKSSVDVYNSSTVFVVVHGLKNAEVAKAFRQLIIEEDKNKIKEPYFAIASENYQIVQIHKNLDAYLNINNN